ncbi:hypothetical protein [Dishui Lake phycodnavirus 4]|jgi:hypothetical protein|nr:hypothetical protein [Dishui Lake phycodnavirus 4]
MKVKLRKSPHPSKKFRVIFEDGSSVDFGGKGYSDFTIHKNPLRMRSYLMRHGAAPYLSSGILRETNGKVVLNKLVNINNSHLENWKMSGVKTAGFWSRWLLWSVPSFDNAKKLMTRKFNITFT